MKKFCVLLMSSIMAATLALSCACSIDTGGGNENNTPEPEEPPVVNEGAEVELTVGTLSYSDERTLINRWINRFNKDHPEVNIKLTHQMQGMPDTTLWESAGNMPDIMWTAGDQHSPYSGYYHYFQDLSDEEKFPGSAEFFSGFYDSLIDSTHFDNTDKGIWFVPRDYNRLVIYINKTAFAEAGVDLPSNNWTWTEFIDICNRLMDKGAKKAIEWKQWRPVYTTMLRNFGGKYLNDDGSLAIDSEETAACVDFYQKFYNTTRSDTDNVVGLAIPGEGTAFKAYPGSVIGSVPMVVDVRPQLPAYMAAASNGEWELEARSFPNYVQPDGSAGYVGAGCSGYGISKVCTDEKKLEWAWKFLKWCMSEEGYEVVSNLGNIVPALTSLRDSGSWREYDYYGATVDAAAFVDLDNGAQSIFLNYQNSLPVSKQDDFILRVDDFWKDVRTKSYADAVETLRQAYSALMK